MNQEMEKRIKTFVAAYREQKKTETAWSQIGNLLFYSFLGKDSGE